MTDYMKLDSQYMMGTFVGIRLAAIDHADGCYVWDTNGSKYADFLAGIATVALGHNHPKVREALIEQSGKLWHGSNYFVSAPQATLAKKLVENTCFDRAFFGNSGAEANEGALKLVKKYFFEKGEKRAKVVTALGSFHGRTLATVAATGQPKYQAPYAPLLPGFEHVPFGDIAAMEAAVDGNTAAVMLEPVQGENGAVVPEPGYLAAVRKICDKHGALLVLDEIQSGMGRTGKLLCAEHENVEADICTLAKALGNGFPIGAILAKESVAQAFKPGDHGTTFGGNALACAVANAVLDVMIEEKIPDRAAKTGAYFLGKLKSLAAKHENLCVQAHGVGLLLGLKLKPEVDGKPIVKQMLREGFIINLAGNNTLRFVPPLVVPAALIDDMLAALDKTLAAL